MSMYIYIHMNLTFLPKCYLLLMEQFQRFAETSCVGTDRYKKIFVCAMSDSSVGSMYVARTFKNRFTEKTIKSRPHLN